MFDIDARGRTGPRDNLAFEGLTLTPNGTGAWVAMENALLQDGPEPTVQAPGGPCRFTLFDLKTGQAVAQRAYVPDAIPRAPITLNSTADNGVSEILMQDAHRMLVLETRLCPRLRQLTALVPRGHTRGQRHAGAAGAQGRQPQADAQDAAGKTLPTTSAASRMASAHCRAWTTPRAWRGGRDCRRLPAGPASRTLVFVSDDNFNPRQITQFIAFEFLEPDA